MRMSRSFKLKIVIAVLLPYFLLAIGSELMHNHGWEVYARSQNAAGNTNGTAYFKALTHQDDEACSTCVWTSANVSGAQAVCTTHAAELASQPIAPAIAPLVSGASSSLSSRGPPVS